ncbi:P-loop containing nucleoside triphosphate hydrolase protein [Aspergillus floccosus]
MHVRRSTSTVTGSGAKEDPGPDQNNIEAKEAPAEPGQKAENVDTASVTNYGRVLGYGMKKDQGAIVMALAVICATGSGVALPLLNIFFGKLIGSFNEFFLPDSTLSKDEFQRSVNQNSLIIVYLFIGKFALTYVSMFSFRMTGLKISARMRLHYMRALLHLPVSKLDEISCGGVANTITGLSNTIQQSVSDKLAQLFQSLALLVAAYVIAFRYSWALTLVTSSALLFIVVCLSFTTPVLVKGQQSVDKAEAKQASIAAEVFNSIRTVFSLGAEGPLSRKYASWAEEARVRSHGLRLVTGLQLGLLMFAMYCSFSLAFWFGLKLFREGHIANISTVITVFFSVVIVVSIMGSIASPLIIISKAISASASFFEVIDSEMQEFSGLQEPEVCSQADIVFENVNFSYPSRPGVQVLKSFSAVFRKGQTTALVGPSGSGKSTIVGLIERWYQLSSFSDDQKGPADGGIFVDGKNINSLDLKWWRTQIGIVQQEPFLFNDTIFNNVAFGLIGSKWEKEPVAIKEKLIKDACREAFADEFVDKLPDGLSTLVGEQGTKLSGGQRQRLAIARSIVKRPSILILDEATSAIDVRGEKIVQAALTRVSRNRTTIVIAHRLSTIRDADHIIVMREGRKIEEGTHDELIAIDDGVYRGLVNAQTLETSTGQGDNLDNTTGLASKISSGSKGSPLAEQDHEEDASEQAANKGSNIWSFGRVLYEQRTQWRAYVLILAAAMGAGSGFPLQSWLSAKLVQAFQFTGQKLVDAANFWALMFFILALSMFLCYAILGSTATHLSATVATAYRSEYFGNILDNRIAFYDREENSPGTLISHLATDPKQLQELLGLNGAFPLVAIFNIVGCVAIAFSFGWKLALVAFFAAMPFLFFSAYMRIRYELEFEAMNAAVYADSSKFAVEAINAFRTVISLTMEDSIIERYAKLLEEQKRKAIRKAWYATLVYAFSDSVELASMALTFWYGGTLLARREIYPSAFFVVFIAIIMGGQSAGQFFSFGPNVAQAMASASRILSMRKSPGLEIHQPKGPLERSVDAKIEFSNVSFHYPTSNTPTFQHINFTIESGQFVAFVGPSGCGKTTVISLLERFYEPSQGCILFGGHNTQELEASSFRKALAMVSQEPKVFEGTIRENILLGLELEQISEEEIIRACQDAEVHDFIMSLPNGYETELGNSAQTSLSGGQKQRLCIARALIRRPRLLLLDEATSSLDSQSEKMVQAAIERLASRRSITIVAVAHRLASIQKADVIFVFGEGEVGRGSKIVEQGSHHELLRRRGVYYQMCQAQALDK